MKVAAGSRRGGFGVPDATWSQLVYLRVQLVEPVLHVAQGTQQVEARLAQVEARVERIEVLLALIDARLLLGCGRKLRRRAGQCPSPLPNSSCAMTLFNCSSAICCLRLAIFSLRIQLAQTAGKRG